MAYNRYQQNNSPWASGAPPMYGSHGPAPPPPPPQQNFYGNPGGYGPSPAPWNPNAAMRQAPTTWGAPSVGPAAGINMQNMQQQRGRMRGVCFTH